MQEELTSEDSKLTQVFSAIGGAAVSGLNAAWGSNLIQQVSTCVLTRTLGGSTKAFVEELEAEYESAHGQTLVGDIQAREDLGDDYKKAIVSWLEADEEKMQGLASGAVAGMVDQSDAANQDLSAEAEEMFMRYDADSSGSIDKKELKAMLKAEGILDGPGGEGALSAYLYLFKSQDANEDGLIQKEEFGRIYVMLQHYKQEVEEHAAEVQAAAEEMAEEIAEQTETVALLQQEDQVQAEAQAEASACPCSIM